MDSLVERLRDAAALPNGLYAEARAAITTLQSELLEQARIIGKSAEREERLAARVRELEASNARLRLDVEAQEALQVSAYHSGLKAGWNFCVSDDDLGYQAAMASTEHIRELRRIRSTRQALADMEQADVE